MNLLPGIRTAAARVARRFLVIAAVMIVASGIAFAQAPQSFNPSDETPEEFPAGTGRDETFYSCVACHNFKLVAAQGMSRRQWEESLELMVNRHGMPPLDDADRKVVLDYLEKTYPPRAPAAGGWQNPFLKR